MSVLLLKDSGLVRELLEKLLHERSVGEPGLRVAQLERRHVPALYQSLRGRSRALEGKTGATGIALAKCFGLCDDAVHSSHENGRFEARRFDHGPAHVQQALLARALRCRLQEHAPAPVAELPSLAWNLPLEPQRLENDH